MRRAMPRGPWGLHDELGTLEVGKRADFALWRIERPAELCYALGANPCMRRGASRQAAGVGHDLRDALGV